MNKDCHLQPRNRVTAICYNKFNEILFLRIPDPGKNDIICLPGDFIKYGELAEETLRGSILRQTELCVEPIDILGIYSNIDNLTRTHIIESVFVCIMINYPAQDSKIGSNKCMWMNRQQIHGSTLSSNENKIVNNYYLWRIQKSTFWTTKI
jgi:8-oxo-dGTP diphosphatase